MAFIKVQKLKRSAGGEVLSGSASIVQTIYTEKSSGKKGHSRQEVVENLGKVLFLGDDGKCGIFHSPSRGLVFYDAKADIFDEVALDDPRLPSWYLDEDKPLHTIFGDCWFLLNFLKRCGYIDVLKQFCYRTADLQRMLCHLLHDVLKDGSKISCEDFIARSCASYFINTITLRSLKSDSCYYSFMGQDEQRVNYFKAFVRSMRHSYPDFGRACYVDSTPLPNDIADNPFNALCSHGTGGCRIMFRLVLVLDEMTGLPVWYDLNFPQ